MSAAPFRCRFVHCQLREQHGGVWPLAQAGEAVTCPDCLFIIRVQLGSWAPPVPLWQRPASSPLRRGPDFGPLVFYGVGLVVVVVMALLNR